MNKETDKQCICVNKQLKNKTITQLKLKGRVLIRR